MPVPYDLARQTLLIGGFTFVIGVKQFGGDFMGQWACPTCGRGGDSRLTFADAIAAREWSRKFVNWHFYFAHKVEDGWY